MKLGHVLTALGIAFLAIYLRNHVTFIHNIVG